jgi:hypothetical protein
MRAVSASDHALFDTVLSRTNGFSGPLQAALVTSSAVRYALFRRSCSALSRAHSSQCIWFIHVSGPVLVTRKSNEAPTPTDLPRSPPRPKCVERATYLATIYSFVSVLQESGNEALLTPHGDLSSHHRGKSLGGLLAPSPDERYVAVAAKHRDGWHTRRRKTWGDGWKNSDI